MSIRSITLSIIVIVFTGIAIAEDPNELNYKPGELLVRFAPKANGKQRTKDERKAILDSINGGKIKHTFKRISGLTLVKLPEKNKVKDKIKVFKNRPGILYAEPNYKIKLLSTTPNDTYFDDLWGMHNTGQSVNGTTGTENADINGPEAWDIATGAEDIIVAVIDSGVDYDHEDLAANMWRNPGEAAGDANGDGKPGIAGFDDDGDGYTDEDSEDREPGEPGYTNDLVNDDDENGYVDDIYGWDFEDNDNTPMDVFGHGTHVAGIIGAVGNNGKGVTGVCWNAKIMAVNISHYGTEGWTIFASNAVKGIVYAVSNGAQILSSAWGDSEDILSLELAIAYANEAGVLFIAAAGNFDEPQGNNNDTDPFYPSCYELDNIISVMATDQFDNRSIWYPDSSHYGATTVDLAAPGSDIYSCKPDNSYQIYGRYIHGCSSCCGGLRFGVVEEYRA